MYMDLGVEEAIPPTAGSTMQRVRCPLAQKEDDTKPSVKLPQVHRLFGGNSEVAVRGFKK